MTTPQPPRTERDQRPTALDPFRQVAIGGTMEDLVHAPSEATAAAVHSPALHRGLHLTTPLPRRDNPIRGTVVTPHVSRRVGLDEVLPSHEVEVTSAPSHASRGALGGGGPPSNSSPSSLSSSASSNPDERGSTHYRRRHHRHHHHERDDGHEHEKDVPYKEIQTILQSVKPLANTGVIIDPKSGRPRFYPREWMRNVDGWLHRKRRGYTDGQKKLILYSCLMESDRGKSWWSTNISMPQVNQPDMSPWLVMQTYDQLRSTFLQTKLPSNCHVVIKHALEQCTQQDGESLTEYANYVESVVNDLSLLQQAPLDLDVVQYFLLGAADKEAYEE